MFTGIVTATSPVLALQGSKLTVKTPESWSDEPLVIGESISINGCCLTVVSGGESMSFDLSEETLARTTLSHLKENDVVNLERALRMGDRLGGHMVQGHVDSVGRAIKVESFPGSHEITIQIPREDRKFLAPKGSITVDGVSLTVVEPTEDTFRVAIIPHTWEVTNLRYCLAGTQVNLEYDILVKHVAQLMNINF